MIESAVDLRSILVKLLFVVLIKIMEVDRVWAEDEVVEGGDTNVLIHGGSLKNKILFFKVYFPYFP